MKTEKSVYFQGINGLRFLAALAVIITHIELTKRSYSLPTNWQNPIIYNLGGFGVYFFFVLSGFLITYLLLVEKEKIGKIIIGKFYIRRILRIWPLYYLITIVGFFILPKIQFIQMYHMEEAFVEDFNANLILYLLILPNLALSMFLFVPHIGQAWSIGVEEQFYIFWPWVISKSRNVFRSLILIIAGLILLKIIVLFLGRFYFNTSWYLPLQKFIAMSKFECMAVGGIGACLLLSNHKLLKFLFHKHVLNISLVLIPVLIFVPEAIQDGIHLVYSFLFLIIILNVSNGTVKIQLENRILNYLGKISYGIYMYHFMIIPFVVCFLKYQLHIYSGFLMNIIVYPSSILLTIAVSSLSFELFENRFIKLKSKFSIIKSGDKD